MYIYIPLNKHIRPLYSTGKNSISLCIFYIPKEEDIR